MSFVYNLGDVLAILLGLSFLEILITIKKFAQNILKPKPIIYSNYYSN